MSSFFNSNLKKYIKQGQGQMSYFSPHARFATHSSLTPRLSAPEEELEKGGVGGEAGRGVLC